ncbi:hypothetical protein MTO96_016276 [Rhipicephalus appendiculatus]
MRRWVSEGTTNTTTRRGNDFRRATTAGNTYSTDDAPSPARTPAPAGPAEDVSVGHLTYSIKSSHPSSGRDKETLCEHHERLRAMMHRDCQSEGQLRPIPAPPRQPADQHLPLDFFRGRETKGPQRAARGIGQGALAPKSAGVNAECTRRDVATATDTVPPDSRWGDWVGGDKLLMVGAALLSILLIASAAATTASIADRRSTAAGGAGHRLHDGAAAGVAPTDQLLPGLIPFTESPGQGDFGAVDSKASAKGPLEVH